MEKQMDKQEDDLQNNQIECYLISVESRKGGVGKTTAALNLARMLVESRQYEVIYLDFDIAGTEMALVEESLITLNIWKDYIYMVEKSFKKADQKTDQPGQKAEIINLVSIFEDYMVGESIPGIEWEKAVKQKKDGGKDETVEIKKEAVEDDYECDEEKRTILLKPGKINIFSSKLNRDGEGENHSYGPATLFDEMHTEWFLSMTKGIIAETRYSLSHEKKNMKLAVVIDNAPGYSGLEPAVEAWLTDLGPRYGKFLLVCSMDTQDFIGCCQALRAIHDIYSDKLQISRYLPSNGNGNGNGKQKGNKIDLRKSREKRFFYRLMEAAAGKKNCEDCFEITPMKTVPQSCLGDDFCFYRQKNKNSKFAEKCGSDPAKYAALLVNKVPELIFNEIYPVRIEYILTKNGFDKEKQGAVYNFLLKKDWIRYREELSYHYMGVDPASKQEKKAGASHQQLLANLKGSKNSFDNDWQNFEKVQIQHEGEFFLKKLVKLQFEYNQVFKMFLNKLSPSQRSDLNNFWNEEFLVISSKEKFFEAVFELFKPSGPIENPRRLAQAVIEEISENIEKNRAIVEAEIIAEACLIFKEEIRERIFAVEDPKIASTTAVLKKGLKTVEMLSVDIAFLKNFNFSKEKVQALITVLYAMQCIYIKNSAAGKEHDIEENLKDPAFWKSQVSNRADLLTAVKETLAKNSLLEEIEILSIKDKPEQLATLYGAFIETTIRLLDLNKDFEFLFDCIRLILLQPRLDTSANVQLNKYAGEVIVEKSKTHAERYKFLQEMGLPGEDTQDIFEINTIESDPVVVLQTWEKLNDYENVLKIILGNARWQLIP